MAPMGLPRLARARSPCRLPAATPTPAHHDFRGDHRLEAGHRSLGPGTLYLAAELSSARRIGAR